MNGGFRTSTHPTLALSSKTPLTERLSVPKSVDSL